MNNFITEGFRAFRDSWSVNSFVKRYSRGEINFDNPIQRGVVWTRKDSSEYIFSLLFGILIYQKPFLISKKDGSWDVLDGKQRGTTLIKFVNNEFALQGLEERDEKFPIIINGEKISLNKKRFKHLPEELQMKLLDFSIDIAMLENAIVDIEALFFESSNSGKAMAKVDLARSRNRSIETVKEIALHPIFKAMFSTKVLEKLPEDEIIVKTWQTLNETDPDFSSKHFNNLMSDLEITDDDKQQIEKIYDTVFAAYKLVLVQDTTLATMMLKKTHFLSYVSYTEMFDSAEKMAEWIKIFYSDIPTDYSEACLNRTAGTKNVGIRMNSVRKSIENFLG